MKRGSEPGELIVLRFTGFRVSPLPHVGADAHFTIRVVRIVCQEMFWRASLAHQGALGHAPHRYWVILGIENGPRRITQDFWNCKLFVNVFNLCRVDA